MKFFRNPADRVPVAIFAAASLIDLLVFLYADTLWMVMLYSAVTLPLRASVCAFNHHHQHVATFYQTWCNRLLEVLYGLHTGISTNAWVLHHNLGHHLNYLDQTKDESAWKDRSGKTMGMLRYTLTIAITGYWRAYLVGRRHPKFQRGFLSAGAIMLMLVSALLWVNWINALFIYLLPMVGGLLMTSWHTYYHHAGLETEDPFHASHNVMHRWYNVFTGNLGYHTAHHVKPGVHWSRLPEFHATIADKIPAHLYVEPCIPFKWFPDRATKNAYPHSAYPWQHPLEANTAISSSRNVSASGASSSDSGLSSSAP